MTDHLGEIGPLLYDVMREGRNSIGWERLPDDSKAYWQERAEQFLALTRGYAPLSTRTIKRPTGLAWVGHVMSSGGFCLIRCSHYPAEIGSTVNESAGSLRVDPAPERNADG